MKGASYYVYGAYIVSSTVRYTFRKYISVLLAPQELTTDIMYIYRPRYVYYIGEAHTHTNVCIMYMCVYVCVRAWVHVR